MPNSDTSRFLVRFRDASIPAALRISARFGMAGTEVVFTTEPLFQSVGVTGRRGVATSGGVWRLASARAQLHDGDTWDHCHAMLEQNAGVALVEPDFEQQWTWRAPVPIDQQFGIKTGGPRRQDIG